MALILVVDDQVENLKRLKGIFDQEGHVLTTAFDTFSAFERLANLPVDLVIADAIMPDGVLGMDMISTFALSPKLQNLPVILLHCAEDNELLGEAATAPHVLSRPFSREILLSKIQQLLGS